MKKILILFLTINIIFFASCEKNTIDIEENTTATNLKKGSKSNTSSASSNTPSNVVPDELIINYPEGTTELQKEQKRLEYGVVNYKKCECADESLELWNFSDNDTDINIEEKKQTATVDDDIEDADLNPLFLIQENTFNSSSMADLVSSAMPKVVNANNGVTIAVLDTGIDYNYEFFPDSFLYNNGSVRCSEDEDEDPI